MTTVAWDGDVLAVDSQATSGCGTKTTTAKMRTGTWQDRDAAYAGVGSRAEADEIADWLFNRGDKPTLDDDTTHGILATYGQAYFVEGKRPRLIPMMDRFHALGTGRETALGAMHCGSSAELAVNIAIRVDAYSGGPVQTHQPSDSPRVEEVVDAEAYRRLKVMHSDAVAEVQRLKDQIQRERRTTVALVSSNVGAESPTLVSVLETTSRWEDPFPMEPGHEPVTDLDLIMMDRAEAYWTELGPFLLPSGDAVRP